MFHQIVTDCHGGIHRPKRPCVHVGETMRQTVCRDCGAALFQTNVSRKWVMSGRLA